MSDTLVKVENVSKKFCRSLKKSLWYGMQDLGNELLGRRHGGDGELRPDEFWAARDVSFELKRGECLGLIGRNGAGKTTLLRMLNGLIKPDAGRIEMRGRVGALIALGAGFNPILTGRENIYVNAAVLGLDKQEIDAKFEDILEFAELGEFIDTPVQSYSSGMVVRLGFAVATALEPDVLILDEILAVGDSLFRQRCLNRISQLMKNAAVIFVSHDNFTLRRICSRAILIERGYIEKEGVVAEVLKIYKKHLPYIENPETQLFISGLSFTINNRQFNKTETIEYGESVRFFFLYHALRKFANCLIVLTFSCDGVYILQAHVIATFLPGSGELILQIETINLAEGYYQVSLTVMEEEGRLTVASWMNFSTVYVYGKIGYGISNQALLTFKMSNADN